MMLDNDIQKQRMILFVRSRRCAINKIEVIDGYSPAHERDLVKSCESNVAGYW